MIIIIATVIIIIKLHSQQLIITIMISFFLFLSITQSILCITDIEPCYWKEQPLALHRLKRKTTKIKTNVFPSLGKRRER